MFAVIFRSYLRNKLHNTIFYTFWVVTAYSTRYYVKYLSKYFLIASLLIVWKRLNTESLLLDRFYDIALQTEKYWYHYVVYFFRRYEQPITKKYILVKFKLTKLFKNYGPFLRTLCPHKVLWLFGLLCSTYTIFRKNA